MNSMKNTEMAETGTSREIDLLDLSREILRKIVWVILAVALCVGVAFCYTKLLVKPTYVSSTTVYIISNNMAETADINKANFLTRDVLEMIPRRPIMETVLNNLRAEESLVDSEHAIPASMNWNALASRVSVSLENEDAHILDIHVTDTDPVRAQIIADEICAVTKSTIKELVKSDCIQQFGKASVGSRSGPNLTQNMMLAGIVGAVLSILVIVVIYTLDDKIKNADHVQRALGLSMLGVIPHQMRQVEEKEETAQEEGGAVHAE